MESESEMPLQVSPAPVTSLLLLPTVNNDDRGSNMSQRNSSSTNASRSLGTGAAVGGDRPIVLDTVQVQTQNSLEWKYVPEATCNADLTIESRYANNFSEHRKTTSYESATDITSHYLNEQIQQPHQQHHAAKHTHSQRIQNIEDQQQDKTIKHQIVSADLTSSRDQILSSPSTEFLGFSTIENNTDNITHITRRRPFESHYLQQKQQQQLQQHSLATLPHHPQPPVQHTATAAEIALGITPSYSQNQNHTMGDGSRGTSMISYADLHRDSKRYPISSQGKEADEEASRTSNSTDSITAMSPGRITPIHDVSSDHGTLHDPSIGIMVGTPSTVSTAPSSDDEALLDYKLDETSALPNLLHPIHHGSNTFGEEEMLPISDHSQRLHHNSRQSTQELHRNQNPWIQQTLPTNPHHAPQRSWDGVTPLITHQRPPQQHPPQQRVASFRNEGSLAQHTKHITKTQQTHTQQFLYQSPQKEHYSPQHFPYQQQQQQMPLPPANRKLSYAHHATPKNGTPPRSGRNQRQQGNRQAPSGGQGSSPHQPGLSSQRSASEVLKTLLRKKACLYEPDTSRSVALVTWLVGRVLALEHGFFSRQQLQSGVHACVSDKIEAGTITRTKVNRCMQIILNSCFHYIIPRSDGTEEKGDYFRDVFSKTVRDDSPLLAQLPEPWNDLVVDRDTVLDAILQEAEEKTPHQASAPSRSPSTSPKHSPKLGSINAEKNPEKYLSDGEKEEASKRAVLLCFNENVRSAEDVFRCHNDFIRDTANATNLQLTAQEWRQFFGREASRDPHLLGNVGIPTQARDLLRGPPRQPDLLGQMSPDEVGKFRSSWCTKRYDHDHDLCGFAHIEVNGGWLRRNPVVYSYKNEMCKFVTPVIDKMVSPGNFFLNQCPNGIACDHAHSVEEIVYHPLNYKARVCTSMYSRSGGCRFGDVCPNVHPIDSNRPFKKSPEGRSPDKRGKKNFDQGKSNTKPWSATASSGSPVVYASPAPISRFEHQLGMPGLQNLYRRQSEVIRAYVCSSGNCQCSYSLFGDNWGISGPVSTLK